MKTILSWRRHHYVARVSIFLIMVALIAGMVGCGGTTTRYSLTLVANPVGGGTATDLTNASPYTAGTGVSIKAVAAAGYEFVNWSAPAGTFANANAAQTTFTMPAQQVTVTANFEPSEFYGGSGTEGAPYQIANWHHLYNVRNYRDSHFILVNDLDSATAGYTERASPTANGGKGWQPIGSLDVDLQPVDPFTGTFDGQGYEIRDLFINRPDEKGVGLFGAVDVGGVIENVEMVDADVTGSLGVGILVGRNDGTVSSSYSSGSVSGSDAVGGLMGGNVGSISDSYSIASVSGYDFVGGLVGVNNATISDCYATGSVDGRDAVGGLVGWNDGGTLGNCYSTGNITGSYVVGGLVGDNDGGTVDSSYSTGNVTGTEGVGGLVGGNDNYGTVGNCYSSGSVDGGAAVGGLVGDNWGTVDSSYSTGSVTGNGYVGGLVGLNWDTVSNSYATGSVTGSDAVGGLVGDTEGGTVSNSFWDTETSGQGTSSGGTGKTTAQMKDFTTFSGAAWDIIAVANINTRNTGYVWNIVDDVTYPFLSWQPV